MHFQYPLLSSGLIFYSENSVFINLTTVFSLPGYHVGPNRVTVVHPRCSDRGGRLATENMINCVPETFLHFWQT